MSKAFGNRLEPELARQHMQQLLADEAGNLERLEALLDQERELLSGTDVEALERAGNARQARIAELLRIDDERRSMCRMLGFPADVSGLQRLLQWCDPEHQLQQQWAECMQKAARCRQSNERNGALVAARLKRVEGLLGVLTGRDRNPTVYSAQGSYAHGSVGHTLAQA